MPVLFPPRGAARRGAAPPMPSDGVVGGDGRGGVVEDAEPRGGKQECESLSVCVCARIRLQ